MTGTYGPRCDVHPDRYGATKTHGPNLWLVLHTSEQSGEHTESAENLCSYLTSPGDRPSSSGGFYGASYHAIFDTDRIIPAVPNHVVAYSAGGGNARGVHGCFPGKARQTRSEWLDAISRAMIRQAAHWVVDQGKLEGIPLRQLLSPQVAAYQSGVCDHYAITLAFGKSSHTDVGASFPWDVLWADVGDITQPKDELMPPFLWRDARYRNWFLVDAAGVYTINPQQLARARAEGLPEYVDPGHDQMLKSLRVKAGLSRLDLIKS